MEEARRINYLKLHSGARLKGSGDTREANSSGALKKSFKVKPCLVLSHLLVLVVKPGNLNL